MTVVRLVNDINFHVCGRLKSWDFHKLYFYCCQSDYDGALTAIIYTDAVVTMWSPESERLVVSHVEGDPFGVTIQSIPSQFADAFDSEDSHFRVTIRL